ncbi:MAG: TlpA disulfide reductase family protein [Acidobacteriaceae bacterium]
MSLRSLIAKNVGTLSLSAMLALSLSLNVYLASKVDFHRPEPIVLIKENAKLPGVLHLLDADGKPAQLALDGSQPTVIYVFSPLCPWCKRNEANVRALVAGARSRYRIVGLSTIATNLKQYIADGRAPFPVYVMKSPDQMRQLGVIGTPETLVIGSGARVEKVWSGAYLEPAKEQIEEYFHLTLPGISNVAALTGSTPVH